jgi:NitT/TauT family transport system permease protein
VAFNSLPRIALVPLTTMIFGFGLLAKIVLAWSIVFFNTFQGARSVDADLIHSAHFLGASERQIMTSVIIPSALAWTFASLTPSISFALIGVVVGEFIGGESGGGPGYLIIQSLGTLNAADMMVALFVLDVIGPTCSAGARSTRSADRGAGSARGVGGQLFLVGARGGIGAPHLDPALHGGAVPEFL